MSLSCGQRFEVCFLGLGAGRNLPVPRGASIASGTGVPAQGGFLVRRGQVPHRPGQRWGRDESDLSMGTVTREVSRPLDGRWERQFLRWARGEEGRGKREGIEDRRIVLSFKTQLSAVEISSSYLVN